MKRNERKFLEIHFKEINWKKRKNSVSSLLKRKLGFTIRHRRKED